jgi:hypothetical protein
LSQAADLSLIPFLCFDFAFEAIDSGLSTGGKFETHKPEILDYQKYRVKKLKKQRSQERTNK